MQYSGSDEAVGRIIKKLQILTGEYKWEEESQKDTFINWMKTDRVGLEEYIKGELIREIKNIRNYVKKIILRWKKVKN